MSPIELAKVEARRDKQKMRLHAKTKEAGRIIKLRMRATPELRKAVMIRILILEEVSSRKTAYRALEKEFGVKARTAREWTLGNDAGKTVKGVKFTPVTLDD